MPDYWIGKDALVEVNNRGIHGPNTPNGSFSTLARIDLGTVVRAHPEGLVLSLHPKEHGHLPQDSGCPYTQVGYLKLVEE